MFRSVHIDDVPRLPIEAVEAIIAWTNQYYVLNAVLISQVPPTIENRGTVLEIWGVPFFTRYYADNTISSIFEKNSELIKLAEFEYDDFPWDLIPEQEDL